MSLLDRTSFLDGVVRYVFIGLYLPFFGIVWNDPLLVVHLGFIIMRKKEFVKRKNKKILNKILN